MFTFQSKSLNHDSGVLFSPPSIVKNTLGASDAHHLLLDDGLPTKFSKNLKDDIVKMSQVQQAHNFLFNMVNNNNQLSMSSSSSLPSYGSLVATEPTIQFNQLRSLLYPDSASSSCPMPTTALASTNPPLLDSTNQPASYYNVNSFNVLSDFNGTTQRLSSDKIRVTTHRANSDVNVTEGSGLVSFSTGGSQQNDKENLPSESDFFVVLRTEDEEIDLGNFQLSKSIFNQSKPNVQTGQVSSGRPKTNQFLPLSSIQSHYQMQQLGSGKRAASHQLGGTSGGYFGFDRTNLMGNSSNKSPAKTVNYATTRYEDKYQENDGFFDANTQSSSAATVMSSSPSPGFSNVDFSSQHSFLGGGSEQLQFKNYDLNDEYWLDFGQ